MCCYSEYFLKTAEIRDVLDSITVIWKALHVLGGGRGMSFSADAIKAPQWLAFVRRVIQEENLGYRVDDQGGVHYFVDEEFERCRISALSCLNEPQYGAVRTIFDQAYQKLDGHPADTKACIRDVFEAIEVFYKHIIKAEERLSSFGV
jgi:hypothetical protein